MPMNLNVGLSKKVGLPDYGSLGASCSVTVELDQQLLRDDLEGFHRQVRQAYVACAQAVNDELVRQQGNQADVNPRANREESPRGETRALGATSPAQGNGSNGTNGGSASSDRGASQKQLDYIRQLAGQIRGLGVRRLDMLAQKMFDRPVASLTSFDASALIDTLKAIKEGRIDLDAALNGAAR